MKRSTFLTSIGALATIPFLSFKKEDKAAPQISSSGKDPYIIRSMHRVSAEQQLHGLVNEEWIERDCLHNMVHHIKSSPGLLKGKVVNPAGSIDYHYLLSIMPR